MTGVGVGKAAAGCCWGEVCGGAWAKAQADANIQVRNMRNIENKTFLNWIMAKKLGGGIEL